MKTRSKGEEKTKPNINTTEKNTTKSLMQHRPVDCKKILPDNRKNLMTHTQAKLLPSFFAEK